jgi:hypothetical protein
MAGKGYCDGRGNRRVTWMRFFCAHSLYTPAFTAFRTKLQSRSWGLHGGISDIPMC